MREIAPDSRDFGRLDQAEHEATVRFVRRLAHAPEEVWRAITEPDQLRAWFPTTVTGAREVGARLRFEFPDGEADPFEGELLAYEPPALLSFVWGDETLRFELEPAGPGTLLTFTASFGELGKAARDGAGWHVSLDLLGYQLAGGPAPWSQADRWRHIHPSYVDRFGPDASTIGPPAEWEAIHGAASGGGAGEAGRG